MATPVQGTASGDILAGTAADDNLLGHAGDDIFRMTGGGQDSINGQGGMDTAVFEGRYQEYLITTKATGNLMTSVVGDGETAELKNVEVLKFDNATYDVATGTAQITTVSIAGPAAVVKEGDGHTLDFTFTRGGDLSGALDVHYGFDGSATAGSDYLDSLGGVLHFDAGSNTATLSLAVVDDTKTESAETVGVHLLSDKHYDFGASFAATGTILDNDVLPTISVADARAEEGGVMRFAVTLSAASDSPVTVQFTTAQGSALLNQDYNGRSGTLTFNPGDLLTKFVGVQTIDDGIHENNEQFFLNLTNPNGATIADGHGIGVIVDNDPLPAVGVVAVGQGGQASVTEGDTLVFNFTRTGDTSQALDVQYSVNTNFLGGATLDSDFGLPGPYHLEPGPAPGQQVAVSTVHFDAGHSDATLSVTTAKDGIAEGNESFFLGVWPSQNGSYLNDQTHLAVGVTINDFIG